MAALNHLTEGGAIFVCSQHLSWDSSLFEDKGIPKALNRRHHHSCYMHMHHRWVPQHVQYKLASFKSFVMVLSFPSLKIMFSGAHSALK